MNRIRNPTAAAGVRLQTLTALAGGFNYTNKRAQGVGDELGLAEQPAITDVYEAAGRLTGIGQRNSSGTILNEHLY